MRARGATAAGLLAALLLVATARDATAQVHRLDDMPWYTVTDTLARRGVTLSYDQYRDPDTSWRSDRLGLVMHTAVGRFGVFFVQVGALRLDTAGQSVLDRWPELAQEDDEGEVDLAWPDETMISGFDKPELGILFPLGLPLLGRGHLGVLAGLPVGKDELYPMSSAALPLLVDWRRSVGRPGGLQGAVRLGFEHTFDSGQEYLTGDAFPSGLRYGVELLLLNRPDRGLELAWSARELSGGRHSRRLSLKGRLPVGGGHGVELRLARELGGKADRYATWIAGISWRIFAAPPAEDEVDGDVPAAAQGGRGQNATGR